jgi:hypothetical protein
MDTRNILDIITFLATAAVGIIAVATYRQNYQLRRAKWLRLLYEEFYDDPKHKFIRRILDYEDEGDLKRLKNAALKDTEPELEEHFVDYLYFFEFISSLWLMKQITRKEIDMLFDYYVKLLLEHDFILPYLKREGYNNTVKFLEAYKKSE